MKMKAGLDALRGMKRSLRWKLFSSMLLLVSLVLITLMTGLYLFGKLDSPKENITEALDLQMEFFENSVEEYWKQLAVMGIDLSQDTAVLLERYLEEQDLTLSDLSATGQGAEELQGLLLEELCQHIRQTACSGGFVILNTDGGDPSAQERPGIYVIRGIDTTPDGDMLLYRGLASVGKEQTVMPHRKWRMSFQRDVFPDYEKLISQAALPLETAYRVTPLATLPGTDEQVMLLTLPMIGKNGVIYGLCGYEVSRRYFRATQKLPTRLQRLICLMAPDLGDTLDADVGLDCGSAYVIPKGQYTLEYDSEDLVFIHGAGEYVGHQHCFSPSQGQEGFCLTVMIPKADYDASVIQNTIQSGVLFMLLICLVGISCLYFSRRFVSPILTALDHMKHEEYRDAKLDIPEIDDLSDFLQKQDQAHESAINQIKQEKQTAENKVATLAYSRKTEIDPDIYKSFVQGLDTLTPTEEKILALYMDGISTKDAIETLGIKESTLRFHNKNIYSKLGVNSRKQAVMYALVAQQNRQETGDDASP